MNDSGFVFPPRKAPEFKPFSGTEDNGEQRLSDTPKNFVFPPNPSNSRTTDVSGTPPADAPSAISPQDPSAPHFISPVTPASTINVTPIIDIPSPAEIPREKFTAGNTFPDATQSFLAGENGLSSSNISNQPHDLPFVEYTSDHDVQRVSDEKYQDMQDWKSPSEYALHILFTKFVRYAEEKLNLCLEQPLTSEPPIINILGEGIDPEFDKVIESLGHIARKDPKPVIDAMMFWRKTKSEAALSAAAEVRRLMKRGDSEKYSFPIKPRSSLSTIPVHDKDTGDTLGKHMPKRHASSKAASGRKPSLNHTNRAEFQSQLEKAKYMAIQSDRRSLISIYTLCRVLIEIVKQAPENSDDDISDKLEEIVFNQLKTTDPQSLSTSFIKSSNWNSFAELLGWMSEKKFVSVSDRFIAELEKVPNAVTQDVEPRVHLLILGMRYLRLKNYPLEKFEECADFMRSLAKFFLRTNNLTIRLAYAEVTSQLLLPLAGSLTAEVNHPSWVEAMETLLKSSHKLLMDNKYWSVGYKLGVSILCVSPPQLFTERWISLIEICSTRIRGKKLTDRIFFSVGISRLVWVYLYRCTETLNNTMRTLQKLLQLYVNTKKKDSWLTTDLTLTNPLADSLVSIGYSFPNFLMEQALMPLMQQSFNGSNLEHINYEKLILAIITYKGFVTTSKRPDFPKTDSRTYKIDLNKLSREGMEDTILTNHEVICANIYKLFLLLDSVIGSEIWSPENQHTKQQVNTFGSFPFGFSSDNENVGMKNNYNILLFSVIIEVIPCCLTLSNSIPYKSTIEILTRNAVHQDKLIASSSREALQALARKANPYTFITWFAKYAFDFDEKTQSSYTMSYLSSPEYHSLLELYVRLLECWLDEFQSSKSKESKKGIGLDGIQLLLLDNPPEETSETEKLQWKNIMTVIEEIEGNGLFFLCSYDSGVRSLGVKILRIISKFDDAMAEKTLHSADSHSRTSSRHFSADQGGRLIDLLDKTNIVTLLSPHRTVLSTVEKDRLGKLMGKHKRGLMIKLAESSYGVDAALWQRVFPRLLTVIFKSFPMTIALCRSVVCIRLVQVHGCILRIASDQQIKLQNIQPETIINQWKLYLIAACAFLTSTNDQKLYIPTTVQQHGRKKSQQIFTVQHQKIKSAKSIFKMVLPLLKSKNLMIRDAIISGLSSMNINIYKTFIESLDGHLTNWSSSDCDKQMEVELFHILAILSRFLKEDAVLEDDWILHRLSDFIKHTRFFLEDEAVQKSFRYQPLRCYFSELLLRYYTAIRGHKLVHELFPFQARVSCFNFLKEWCGYGDYAYIADERYAYFIQMAETEREKTTITAGIEFQKARLEMVALEAMVMLVADPIVETLNDVPDTPVVISFDIEGLLTWVEALFNSESSNVRNIGVLALENLLQTNTKNAKLFKSVATQCISYHTRPSVAVLYYTTLCNAVLKLDDLILDEDELVSLGLYGLVSEKEDTRVYAVDLLSAVETKLHSSSYTKVFKERIANSSKMVYRSTAFEISSVFAELLSQDFCLRIFSSLVRILELFPFSIKKDLLVLMTPWVNKFTLKSLDDLDTFMVLNNFFYVTLTLNDRLPKEVEQLWMALGKGNSLQNIHICLDYVIKASIDSKSSDFVQTARDVVLYLSSVPGSLGIVDILLANLDPKQMVPTAERQITEPVDKMKKYSFIANIKDYLNSDEGSFTFSKAQLSIIFLVNLLTDISEAVKSKISVLLHVSICLLDHYNPLIQESSSKLLCSLIFGIASNCEETEDTIDLLRNRDKIWSYDSLVRDKKGSRSPKAMDPLIKNLIKIFSENESLQTDWQRVALKWATACPVRRVACRSFQVFRSLLSFLDQGMLRDMLHRLSNTISDENPDIQGFAMQILMTLNAIMAELEATDLIGFPHLFWSIVACMSSIHEQEFVEVLSCITKFISKIDLDSPDTVQCLIATFPSDWEGRFDGLQQIALTGLRSSTSLEVSLKFLDRINLLKDSRIVAESRSRLLFALISNLPRFLNAMDYGDFSSLQGATDALIGLANTSNQPSLSRLIDSMAKNKFRSKKDFMSQVVSFISRNYFPEYEAQTLVFLLGLLQNKLGWIKVQTMEILKYVFPLVDLTRPEFSGVGADLISPLLRLLMTEYDTLALEVLDCVPNVPGSRVDKDILRISMGNKDIKNNMNGTATLFGIPDENGWSIPMPAITAATTRHNVHTVFIACANTVAIGDSSQEQDTSLDDVVEFHAENEYPMEKLDTLDSFTITDKGNASLSHMWAELDSLDSFFTRDTPPIVPAGQNYYMHGPHERSDSVDTMRTEHAVMLDSAPQLYDKKVSVILNRSLSRSPSNVSFKKHLADSFATGFAPESKKSDRFSFKSRVDGILDPLKFESTPPIDLDIYRAGSTSPIAPASTVLRSSAGSTSPIEYNLLDKGDSNYENGKSTRFSSKSGRSSRYYRLPRF